MYLFRPNWLKLTCLATYILLHQLYLFSYSLFIFYFSSYLYYREISRHFSLSVPICHLTYRTSRLYSPICLEEQLQIVVWDLKPEIIRKALFLNWYLAESKHRRIIAWACNILVFPNADQQQRSEYFTFIRRIKRYQEKTRKQWLMID